MKRLLHKLKLLRRGEGGFTLIEQVAVVSILAVLVSLVVPDILNAKASLTMKAHAIKIEGQYQRIREAVYLYYQNTGQWPTEWSEDSLAAYPGDHQLWCNRNDADTGTVCGWDGPYIERPILRENYWNGYWGVVEDFRLSVFGADEFTCLVYFNVPKEVCRQVDKLMDDGTGDDDEGQDSGLVQYDDDGDANGNGIVEIPGEDQDWRTMTFRAGDGNVLVIAIAKQ